MKIKVSIALITVAIIMISVGSLMKILHYGISVISGSNIIFLGFLLAVSGIAFNFYIHHKQSK